MRILDARRHINGHGRPQLTVLVDRIPRVGELTFRVIDLGRVRPMPNTMLYVGVHPDGYVTHLVDIGDQRGFYGQTFHLRLDDGTTRRVVGPYRGSFDLVDLFAADMRIRTDVGVLDDPEVFAGHRDGRGALPAGLTASAVQTALELAIARGRAEQAEPTHAFDRIGWDAGRTPLVSTEMTIEGQS